jgi:hypothetical protein
MLVSVQPNTLSCTLDKSNELFRFPKEFIETKKSNEIFRESKDFIGTKKSNELFRESKEFIETKKRRNRTHHLYACIIATKYAIVYPR